MEFKEGDRVMIVSSSNTNNAFGANDDMQSMVGQTFTVVGIESNGPVKGYKIEGFTWHPDDLKKSGEETDPNLIIPRRGGHCSASTNGEYDLLIERIGYVGAYLQGLHNTDVFKKGSYKIQRYDGSGKMYIEGIPQHFMARTKLDLLQRKKVGFVRDKPDVIIMLDNSSSVSGAQMNNHMRVLSAAISDVFFAELNKVYLVTFGERGEYYEFDDRNVFVDQLLEHTFFDEGCTAYDLAFIEALKNGALKEQTRPRLVLLLTDGVPTDLASEVGRDLEELRISGAMRDPGYKDPKTMTKKETLIRAIDMIASLSALDNTVFRTYVLSETCNVDRTYERIAREVADRLKGADDLNAESQILMRRFIREIMKNGQVLGFSEFTTGQAFHKITEDIKEEFYKLQAMR
jgi:hypothetical protein